MSPSGEVFLSRLPIGITMGDVNGIGPEILVKALGRQEIRDLGPFVIYGEASIFERARGRFQLDGANSIVASTLTWKDTREERTPLVVEPGALSATAGAAAHAWIEGATRDALDGRLAALVTCPVNKEAMLLAGKKDLGHTEILARLCDSADWRMCLYSAGRLVVHLSGHLPIRAALEQVTRENVMAAVRLADEAMCMRGVANPRIAVAGLNPHAGEHGAIGAEDGEIILPAVRSCRDVGIDCSGPHSPDAVFRQLWNGDFDAVIALYHDQGHIAMKMVGMDECASLTLGLPIVRTSPDHGTAFDIAWQGLASGESLCTALCLAAELAASRRGGAA